MGRTGAGKSSLIQALFRLLEAESGSICIDGLDIGEIELERLRASLAIIPQEPFIFHGTVRENLDPSAEFEDTQIWDCLAQTGLFSTAASMPDGLDTIVGSEGGKLSEGHRQLLALARAFLSGAKIVVLDEATSAIDKQTERLIQQTLRGESFAEKTLIIIAHRLDTIAHCHRIVTLQDGQIVGVDEPRDVLDDIVD